MTLMKVQEIPLAAKQPLCLAKGADCERKVNFQSCVSYRGFFFGGLYSRFCPSFLFPYKTILYHIAEVLNRGLHQDCRGHV